MKKRKFNLVFGSQAHKNQIVGLFQMGGKMKSYRKHRDLPPYVSGSAAARIIGCTRKHATAMADKGLITLFQLPPGVPARTRYSRADCERIAKRAVIPAQRGS